jgi:hypothetical protein
MAKEEGQEESKEDEKQGRGGSEGRMKGRSYSREPIHTQEEAEVRNPSAGRLR